MHDKSFRSVILECAVLCHQQSTLTSISVTTKSRSLIFNKPTAEESSVKESFGEHLKTTTSQKLKDLLIFAAGAPCVPYFGLGKINVEFTYDSSTYDSSTSSTCLKKVTFPRKFPDNDTSLAAIHAVCDNAGRAFINRRFSCLKVSGFKYRVYLFLSSADPTKVL